MFVSVPNNVPSRLFGRIANYTRRLATANRSCVSIRATEVLARTGSMVDPVKIFLRSSLITVKYLIAVFHAGCKIFGYAGTPPPWYGAWLTSRNTFLPPLCYHTEFGRSNNNNNNNNNNQISIAPYASYRDATSWCIITESLQKVWPFTSRLSGSLKVIGTDADRSATYDFLSVFNSNYGPILYRFWDPR